jgi:hypothetical protein
MLTVPASLSAAGTAGISGIQFDATRLSALEIYPTIGGYRGQPPLERAFTTEFFQQGWSFAGTGHAIGPKIGQEVLRLGPGSAACQEYVRKRLMTPRTQVGQGHRVAILAFPNLQSLVSQWLRRGNHF